ncbi:tyrosine-protein kinase BAZ1B-like isoform X2 [Mizuhopecten yessoensis]|uniref:tyrosine-protein kinase BAZ1B-like isoform X2 n=1 Tax=Mizuhopecten yessoensis TaxID=6573 RepID=UPI000B45A0E6|nr:tyrosine-protein kinase BAZ1B-like isoform X2 [Mizuhopecten yessoensis]
MPLLGKKIFVSVKPLKDIRSDEKVYTVPYSKEQFRSQKEFDERCAWYDERIWTCRCTGHTNLTHQEAWNSEKIVNNSLKQQFPSCHNKPVLEHVHHSTLTLDTLVDQAWLLLQQVLSVGETVTLKVKSAGKPIKGHVIKVNKAGIEANPTSNCNSPSSDKENSAEDTNGSPQKWLPPKLLPYKYSLHLDDEDKVINEIPALDISRLEKVPSKELLRLFIRANALRVGQNQTSPWVVDDSHVKEFGLPNKFAHFLLSPIKKAEMNNVVEDEPVSKKRKLSLQPGLASKKAKIDKVNSAKKTRDTGKAKQTKLTGASLKKSASVPSLKSNDKTSPKKSPKKYKTPETIEIVTDSSSDEDCPLAKLQTPPPRNKSPAKKSSPKKALPKKEMKKTTSKMDKKRSPKKSKKSLSEKKKSDSKNTPKKRKVVAVDSDEDQPLSKLKQSPKKSMKQMTLFEMSKKKGLKTPEKKKITNSNNKTPDKKDRKKVMTPPRTPAIVSKMVRAHKMEDQAKFKLFVQQAAKILTSPQRKRLPPQIKDTVDRKYEFFAEKKKISRMTPEQREAYLKEKQENMKLKRNAKKQEIKQKNREKLRELKKKYEDQSLTGKPLPPPKLVPTPDGLPNEMFGEVTFIAEFINCYSGLLMPDESYPIRTDALMKALSCGTDGFTYLSRALVVLLQTLLQDEIAEDYQEIRVPLSDIPVNACTASELTRLCLRRQDDDNDHYAVEDDMEILLETQEMYQLELAQKIQILKGLCLRIMGTYSVQDFMEEKQTESSKLWRKRLAVLKVKNTQLKKEKEQNKKEKAEQALKEPEKKKVKEEKEEKNPNLTISHFYGQTSGDQSDSSKPATPEPADSAEDGGDLASVVKRRRMNTAKAAAEREQRQHETRKQKEKEYEEYRKQKQEEDFEKDFVNGIALAKSVLRHTPIGTDRNHSRYWVFSGVTPGLYIEKGWVNKDIDYCTREEGSSNWDSDDSDTSTNMANKDEEKQNVKTTVPRFGQNLWFTYSGVKELDTLIDNLHPQGYRESSLKNELKKRYAEISVGIFQRTRASCELRDSDGDKEMLDGFRKELLDTEMKLRYGGLGGVDKFEAWEEKLESATDIAVFGKLMMETQEGVSKKFRQGIMGLKKKKTKVTEVTEVKEEKEAEEDEEEEKEIAGIVEWREAVESASTLSRLHVLMAILDNSIKWEKSAENAKCKICRKKGEEQKLLLCDECNQPFHMYCLRPALIEIPRGDWFCASCMPQNQRRKSRVYNIDYDERRKDRNDEYTSDSNDSLSGEIEHEENCAECGGDEGLIFCAECPTAYHLECHDPPLRHPPRGRWICTECKTGVKRNSRSRSKRKVAKKSGRAAPKRKKYAESSDESEEEEEEEVDSEEAEEEEEEEAPKKSGRRVQQKSGPGRKPGSTNKKEKSRSSTGSNSSLNDSRTYTSRRAPSELSICEQIVGDVMKMESSWPFLLPVNKKDVPDYHRIVKHPMDLQLVKDKLKCMVYGSVEEVIEDVKQIFINAETYNKVGSEVLDCKEEVERNFALLIKKNLPMCLYARGRNSQAC